MNPSEETMTIKHVVTFEEPEWIGPLIAQLKWRLDKIMATLQERFDAIGGKLDEASSEIKAEIQKLKDGGTLTPEQETALAAIEAKANALADIAPAVE